MRKKLKIFGFISKLRFNFLITMSVIKTLYYFQIFEFGKIKKKRFKKIRWGYRW